MMQQAEEAQLESYLIKPYSDSSLFDTIMGVFDYETKTHKEIDPFSLESVEGIDRIRGAHLLLVEDKEVNQEVACGILEGEGFRVSLANNGLEALEKVKAHGLEYDLVIMDLQMPEMDGYTAAKEIRRDSRFQHLPILAMTADAMSGVKERVADAGMNGHASKPIDPPKLFAELVKWIDPARIGAPESSPAVAYRGAVEVPDLPGIDKHRGLSRLQGRTDLYLRVLSKFAERQGDAGDRLRETVLTEHYQEADRILHSLKGVVGSISAPDLLKAVNDLDDALQTKSYAQLQPLLEVFSRELDIVLQGLHDYFGGASGKARTNSPTSRSTPEELNSLLAQLRELLKDDDTGATVVLSKLREAIPSGVADQELSDLEKAVEEYDFELALKLLDSSLQERLRQARAPA
jgi:CheY-like chemotaxis protein